MQTERFVSTCIFHLTLVDFILGINVNALQKVLFISAEFINKQKKIRLDIITLEYFQEEYFFNCNQYFNFQKFQKFIYFQCFFIV